MGTQDTARQTTSPAAAVYLRCYPRDVWAMETHRTALLQRARQLRLPEPAVFLDNGCRSAGPLPALESLTARIADGWYQTVLVPGRFVFSLIDEEAARITQWVEAHGCRLEELPG
ncbi:hypothetical protein ACIGXA_33350 [Streptomyces fildesensis]|uniref:Resolvase/invertase-type recombinase catalytic domain-containing protein n=1 Tax=Streptomyces fildesensis TaxID=375757 RepID=A0ABW8CG33_9ACTN